MNVVWQIAIPTVGLVIIGLVGLAHLFLHAKPTPIDSVEALTKRMRQGQPTLLYFYTNF